MSANQKKNIKKNFMKLQGISKKTQENYTYFFGKVKELIGRTRLTTHSKVIDIINNAVSDPATRGNYYTSIIKHMELKNPDLKPTNEPSTKEEKAFVAYKLEGTKQKKTYNESVKKVPEELKDTKMEDLVEKYIDYVKENKYNISNDELLVGLYILQPPRRLDYTELVYSTSKSIPKDQTKNYLMKDKIVFNEYSKTKNTYGQQVIPIKNKELKKIIKKLNFTDDQTIFSFSKRTLQRKLQTTTIKVLGQELNIRQLRVLHNTDKYSELKGDMKEMKEDAFAQGHSVQTKMNVYVRERD